VQLADCHVGLDGLGLIGGSMAAALRKSGQARSVLGWDLDPRNLSFAQREGLIDEAASSLDDLAKRSDLLVLSVPLGQVESEARKACSAAGDRLEAVMDVGSAKTFVAERLSSLFGPRYLGFHPMAGGEKGGVQNASPDLFRDAVCALVPTGGTSREVLALGGQLAAALGAEALVLDPVEHDRIAACTSHVPMLVALALCLAAEELLGTHPDLPLMAAGGFRDTTRPASNPPWLVADIWSQNRDAVSSVLDRLVARLGDMKNRSPEEMGRLAEKAKASRETILAQVPRRWKS
jgi:prephenate dehydrogenase